MFCFSPIDSIKGSDFLSGFESRIFGRAGSEGRVPTEWRTPDSKPMRYVTKAHSPTQLNFRYVAKSRASARRPRRKMGQGGLRDEARPPGRRVEETLSLVATGELTLSISCY